ncbi:MAG: hypothetical protein LW750_04305 [Bacteroidetes bacterium]|nr:hypothetical protein [Bacteroidota bacterium]
MAKKVAKKSVKSNVKKALPKAGKTAVKKAVKGKSTPKAAPKKPAKSKPAKSKPVAKPATKKAVRPVVKKKAAPAKAKPVQTKKVVATKPTPKAQPAAKKTVPAPVVKAEPKAVKAAPVAAPKKKEKPVKGIVQPEIPAIDKSKLPKLPSHLSIKKPKGKLAPGEKRLVKTEVITHHVITDKPIEELNGKPEPKGKFVMEFIIHSPISLIYDFLTTPNGLAEWFAEEVDLDTRTQIYTFKWDGAAQQAQILNAKMDSYIRMRWLDKPKDTYFEFRLDQDEMTNEVALTVTDFGDGEDDIETNRRLWDTQIHRLVKSMGTY